MRSPMSPVYSPNSPYGNGSRPSTRRSEYSTRSRSRHDHRASSRPGTARSGYGSRPSTARSNGYKRANGVHPARPWAYTDGDKRSSHSARVTAQNSKEKDGSLKKLTLMNGAPTPATPPTPSNAPSGKRSKRVKKWRCDNCAFENGGGTKRCDICKSPRPFKTGEFVRLTGLAHMAPHHEGKEGKIEEYLSDQMRYVVRLSLSNELVALRSKRLRRIPFISNTGKPGEEENSPIPSPDTLTVLQSIFHAMEERYGAVNMRGRHDKGHPIFAIFQLFDSDHNGRLDPEEYKSLVLHLGLHFTHEEMENAFVMCDEEGRGSITAKGLLNVFRQLQRSGETGHELKVDLLKTFSSPRDRIPTR